MDVVGYLLRTDLRRHRRGLAGLIVLLVLAGGTSAATFAAWRRTDSAMARFVDSAQPLDLVAVGPGLSAEGLLAIPGVEQASTGDYFLLVPDAPGGGPDPAALGSINPFSSTSPDVPTQVEHPIVVAGRLADPDEELEVVVDDEAADRFNLRPGDTFPLTAYAPEQVEELFARLGELEPAGPRFELTVAGVVRQPSDVVPPSDDQEVVYLGDAEVYLGPAFHREHWLQDVASIGFLEGAAETGDPGYFELRAAAGADLDAIGDAVEELTGGDGRLLIGEDDQRRALLEASRAIDLQAAAVLILGLLLAVIAATFAVAVIARLADADRRERSSLAAVGVTRRATAATAGIRAAIAGFAAAPIVVAMAVALSPLGPVGVARRAEVDPGFQADWLVLAVAAALVVLLPPVAAVVVGLVSVGRRGPAPARRGILADRLAAVGVPVPVVAGVRLARRGAGALGAAAGVVAGVACAVVLAAVVFADGVSALRNEPRAYGWAWDVVLGDGNDPRTVPRALEELAVDPDVAGITVVHSLDTAPITGPGGDAVVPLSVVAPEPGGPGPATIEGRAPAAGDEVALGAVSARQLGVGVGDEVEVEGEEADLSLRVTGLVALNIAFDMERVGEGALVATAAAEDLGFDLSEAPGTVLVSFREGVDPDAAVVRLREQWGPVVLRPVPPTDVANLERVQTLPLLLAAVVVVLAAVALAASLSATLRRRRSELALLRTIGLLRRQLAATVAVQAAAIVVPAAIAGVVVGVGGGRLVWRSVLHGLGAPEVPASAWIAAVLAPVGSALIAVVLAAPAGRRAGRVEPGVALRDDLPR